MAAYGINPTGPGADTRTVHNAGDLGSVVFVLVAAGVLVYRAARGLPLVARRGRLEHWTAAMSGGRWSAAGFSGLAVAFVGLARDAWMAATLGLMLAIPAMYAAVSQLRRGRF